VLAKCFFLARFDQATVALAVAVQARQQAPFRRLGLPVLFVLGGDGREARIISIHRVAYGGRDQRQPLRVRASSAHTRSSSRFPLARPTEPRPRASGSNRRKFISFM
jgi:hypothetical protein